MLTELPFASLGMGRRLDEVSEANVVVTASSLNNARGWTETERDRCCGYLAELNPWEHELALWRDGDPDDDEPAWVGPILEPEWGTGGVVIPARDLAQWFERRLLERDRVFVGEDLADIFYRYVVDALRRDPTPNITVNPTPTGITGDRTVLADARRRAMDELRELARTGLDFTAKGRRILVGGSEIDTDPLGKLLTEHFAGDGPRRKLAGLDAITEPTVIGARQATGRPIIATAGGIDPDLGLLQDVHSESSIEDEASAQAAADTRHDMLATAPEIITGTLDAGAPVSFSDLVPGARADLRLRLFCLDVVGTYRLQDVTVSVSSSGNVTSEEVGVTFVTLGTVEEAA